MYSHLMVRQQVDGNCLMTKQKEDMKLKEANQRQYSKDKAK